MTIKISALCIMLTISVSAFGQWGKKKSIDKQPVKDTIAMAPSISQDTVYVRMYHNGLRYGDYRLSIMALHALYAIHPDKINYLDSLCLLYAQTENYTQCILTGVEVMKKMPDNVAIISALAVSEQQVGRYAESLDMYQKEYAKKLLFVCSLPNSCAAIRDEKIWGIAGFPR